MKPYHVPKRTETEIDKEGEPNVPFTMETRQCKRGRNRKKYNPFSKEFVVDRIVLSDVARRLLSDRIVLTRYCV